MAAARARRNAVPVAVVHGYFAAKSAQANLATSENTDSAQFQLPAQTAMKEFFAQIFR